MQLGTSAIALLSAAGVGVAAVVAALVLVGVRRARRRPAPVAVTAARADAAGPDPCAADWTGEAASGAADLPGPPRRPTVADAVAARRADTHPFPVVPRVPDDGADQPSRGTGDTREGGRHAAARPSGAARAPSEADPMSDAAASASDSAEPAVHRVVAAEPSADRAGSPAAAADRAGGGARVVPQTVPGRGVLPFGDVPDLAEDTDGLDMVEPGPVPPPWSAARGARIEPSPAPAPTPGPAPVSVAVRQALAAREMRRMSGPRDTDGEPVPVGSYRSQDDRSDARDRLLAVLLADPAAALGATEQLGEVVRRRRAELGTAVRRLHTSGLNQEQIGRLAGLDDDTVRDLLDHGPAR